MVYVTSDLHGCSLERFQALLKQAGFLDGDYLFILGDVIDRGEEGAKLLLWLTQQGNMQLILGNHEAMLLSCRFLFDEVNEENLDKLTVKEMSLLENWMGNGAAPTLKGLQKLGRFAPQLLEGVLEYLQDAPLYEDITVAGRRFVLCHAGLGNFSPKKPLEDYTPHELLWTRPWEGMELYEDATVIFGHTPVQYLEEGNKGRAVHGDGWICIDTGAAMGGMPMLLRLEDMKEFYTNS